MRFMTQIAIGIIVKRSSWQSFPPDLYSPPLPNTMQGGQSSDPNEFLTSHSPKSILTRGPSPSNLQPNSPRSSTPSSPILVDHDSAVTVYFKKINMLD